MPRSVYNDVKQGCGTEDEKAWNDVKLLQEVNGMSGMTKDYKQPMDG